MTVLIVLGFMVVSCATVVCILSYCKTRILKNTEGMNNRSYSRNPTNSANSRSNPTTTIFVVPTTSQVIEMYVSQANSAEINNVNNLPADSPVRRPPSYGTVIVDVPPSYEQAIQHLDNERK